MARPDVAVGRPGAGAPDIPAGASSLPQIFSLAGGLPWQTSSRVSTPSPELDWLTLGSVNPSPRPFASRRRLGLGTAFRFLTSSALGGQRTLVFPRAESLLNNGDAAQSPLSVAAGVPPPASS